jgi:hypothetical protein
VMLGLAGWLYLRMDRKPRWAWILVLAVVIAAEGIPVWGPLPLIAGELGVLVLLTLMPLKGALENSAEWSERPDLLRPTPDV